MYSLIKFMVDIESVVIKEERKNKDMNFTYSSYKNLIDLLKSHNYAITSYLKWKEYERCVILRHDIDNDIDKAVKLAKIENEEGISSTYFVLVTSDFYNVFSANNGRMLKKILELGHDIGIHFDEVRYPNVALDELTNMIKREAQLLSMAVGSEVKTVSMHRPSKSMLEEDLIIPGMINSYSKVFFKEFKYVSDSRRRWREPVEEIISSNRYDRLHILTHAFWYNEEEKDIRSSVREYVNRGSIDRYLCMKENITDISSIMQEEEVVHE